MLMCLITIAFPHMTTQSPVLPQVWIELTYSITYVATFSLLLDLWTHTKPALFQLLFFTSTVATGLEMLRDFAREKITLPGQYREAESTTLSFQLMPTVFFLTTNVLLWIFNGVLSRKRVDEVETDSSQGTAVQSPVVVEEDDTSKKTSSNWRAITIGVIVFAAVETINMSMAVRLPLTLWILDTINYAFVTDSSRIASAASAVSGVLSIVVSIFVSSESQTIVHVLIVASSLLWAAIVAPSSLLLFSIGQALFAFGYFALLPCTLCMIEKRRHLSSFSLSLMLAAFTLGSLIPDFTYNYDTKNNVDLFISLNGLVFNFVIIFLLLLIKKKV